MWQILTNWRTLSLIFVKISCQCSLVLCCHPTQQSNRNSIMERSDIENLIKRTKRWKSEIKQTLLKKWIENEWNWIQVLQLAWYKETTKIERPTLKEEFPGKRGINKLPSKCCNYGFCFGLDPLSFVYLSLTFCNMYYIFKTVVWKM